MVIHTGMRLLTIYNGITLQGSVWKKNREREISGGPENNYKILSLNVFISRIWRRDVPLISKYVSMYFEGTFRYS
jgi:hypothetical protein